MRLLDTLTGQFIEKDPEKDIVYAILSHTWDKNGEQTYEQLRNIQCRYVPELQTPRSLPKTPEISSDTPALGTWPLAGLLASSPPLRPIISEGSAGALSGEQNPSGPVQVTLLSEQPPSDSLSGIAPLIPQSTRPKSLFTRGMARLKKWIQYRSARNAPHSPSGSPSTSRPRRTQTAIGRHLPRAPENKSAAQSPASPSAQHLNDSGSPLVTPHPPSSIGPLIQSEVDASLHPIADITSSAPAPIPTDSSAHAPDHQSTAPSQSIWDDPELSPKIRDACRVAHENGYRYIWIDSCCIDKSSSSELSEAINSMYKWYGLAAVCYTYLADVPPGDDHHAKNSRFRLSRWFRRGWTLQELIAPVWLEFLSQDWVSISSKHAIVDLVESVTKISVKALLHVEPLDAFSVTQRLSWAADRETTREEDRAYSLLGIFDIHMPTLYGEGNHAFRRLQEQIMQRIPDQSLFAWGNACLGLQSSQNTDLSGVQGSIHVEVLSIPQSRHLFAPSPDYFKDCEGIAPPNDTLQSPAIHHNQRIQYTSTPYGIYTQLHMIPLTRDLVSHAIPPTEDIQLRFLGTAKDYPWYLAILWCEHMQHPGHLLGRLCYIAPSKTEVEFVYTGLISVKSSQGDPLYAKSPYVFPLSPEIVQRCHSHIEHKMVYIPHPDRSSLRSNPKYLPYTTIKLVLLRKTCDTLLSQGFSAHLCNPDQDHPTTHCLTLSGHGDIIAITFQHTLGDEGDELTIDAEVKMLGSRVQMDFAPDSDQTDCHTVSWWDCTEWVVELDSKSISFSGRRARILTVNLGLDFAGSGVYFLRVDVLSEAPPACSAIEIAVDQEGDVEGIKET